MVSSRKQRAKGEQTFLENVKSQLAILSEDIVQIKQIVESIRYDAIDVGITQKLRYHREPNFAPPPPPPPLDVITRNTFLSYRGHVGVSRQDICNLPKMVEIASCERGAVDISNSVTRVTSHDNPAPAHSGVGHPQTSSQLQKEVRFESFHVLPSVGTWLLRPPKSQALGYCPPFPDMIAGGISSCGNRISINFKTDFRALPESSWRSIYTRFHGTAISGSSRSFATEREGADDRGQKDVEGPRWTEKETGEYVMALRAGFMNPPSGQTRVEAFQILEEGVRVASLYCPESNRPWLWQFLNAAKQQMTMELKHVQEHETIISDDALPDQQWHDESRARWIYRGQVICYFCGEADCEDRRDRCCERRRREILGIDDEKLPSRRKRKNRKR